MTDLYHDIYTGEIFQKSQCIWHENTLMDFFRSNLTALGYHSVGDSNKVWRRDKRTVVVCLVDDFSTCSTDYSTALPYMFDQDTIVITDNYVSVPTQYEVFQLPPSFFGIYAHQPELTKWEPTRRFNFAVNRMDSKRLLMFLEMQMRANMMVNSDNLDYVNFNCWSWDGDNSTVDGLVENVKRQYEQLEPQYREVYQETYERLLAQMPFRNHELMQEQAHVGAWVNLVMETYSSDTTIALSEKTFRALCLPVPFMLYSGRNTLAYLHSLGFDILQDVIEHRYDSMIENRTAAYGDKMVDFVFEGADAVERMQTQNLAERCQEAAEQNAFLLHRMRDSWPTDFAQWWVAVSQRLR